MIPGGPAVQKRPFHRPEVIITAGVRGLPPPSSGSTPARGKARGAKAGTRGSNVARNMQGALVGPGDRLSPAGYPRLGSGQGVKCAAHSLTSARRRVAKPSPADLRVLRLVVQQQWRLFWSETRRGKAWLCAALCKFLKPVGTCSRISKTGRTRRALPGSGKSADPCWGAWALVRCATPSCISSDEVDPGLPAGMFCLRSAVGGMVTKTEKPGNHRTRGPHGRLVTRSPLPAWGSARSGPRGPGSGADTRSQGSPGESCCSGGEARAD